MKKSNPELFPEFSHTAIVLKRYDGTISILDLSEKSVAIVNWWICQKSTKPVDRMG